MKCESQKITETQEEIINSDWPFIKIGDVSRIFDGPHATPSKTTTGPIFLGISCLKRGQLDLSNTEHLGELDFIKWTKRVLPQAEDIVFSYETRIGEVAIIPAGLRCCLGRRMALIRSDIKQLLPNYLLYYFMSDEFQSLLRTRTIHGSTVDRLLLTEFPNYQIRLPPLPTQKRVSETLKSLDDRITLLRETNTTLEAIAQALFKSWFIDFDPVHAKMQGQIPEGMDEATAALFPDSFEESELGLVPNGWQKKIMSDISTVGIGKTPPRKEEKWFSKKPHDIRWTSIRDMGSYGVYALQTNEFLTREAVEKFNIRLVPNNTTLMSFKMTIGRVAITDGEITTNEAIAHFRLDGQSFITSEYIYLHLKQFNFTTLSSTSSIADAVNSKGVREIPIIEPSKKVTLAFQEIINPIFQRIKNSELQIINLMNIRDELLPRLISGQLKVPEVN